jgi:hypothetical protein
MDCAAAILIDDIVNVGEVQGIYRTVSPNVSKRCTGEIGRAPLPTFIKSANFSENGSTPHGDAGGLLSLEPWPGLHWNTQASPIPNFASGTCKSHNKQKTIYNKMNVIYSITFTDVITQKGSPP